MQTKATIERAGSPVPGVIPEPVRVEHDSEAAAGRRPTAPRTPKAAPALRRRPVSRAWARVLSALHGDKYLLPTDPPTWAAAPTVTPRTAGTDEPPAAARGTRDAS